MILYFTGTNNSKYVADYLGDHLQDEVVAIVDLMKQKNFSLHSLKPFIIVAPIYCYRFPILVENYLKDCNFIGNQSVYCIGTMQSQTGKAGLFLKKIFEEKGLEFKGFRGIRMPNNYYLVSNRPAPYPFDIETIIRHAQDALEEVIASIQQEKTIKKDDFSPFAYTLSAFINPLFVKWQLKWQVNDDCIHCNQCIQDCPVGNIVEVHGKIIFKKECIQCLRCINHCPKQAINISKKTIGKARYIAPSYKSR